MGLAEIQRVLAQLYTNTTLRERFLADPQGVGQALGLATTEVEQVAQLSAQQVRLFAESLHNKRLGEVYKLLPLSYKVLGKTFSTLFHHYADTSVPSGIKKHRDDAIAFATFVEQRADEKGIEPAWAIEVLRYEKSQLMASEVTRRLVVFKSRYAIDKLLEGIERGDEVPPLALKYTFVLWCRFSSRGKLRRVIW